MADPDQNTTTSSTNTANPTIQAKLVGLEALQDCAARLRDGHLVAFPTETVYGLGCHALDETAILKVFAAKERPLTDPLIVHVSNFKQAQALWQTHTNTNHDNDNNDQSSNNHHHVDPALQSLTKAFWPGPLTLVAKAAATTTTTTTTTSASTTTTIPVPSILMAHTGYVACRSPAHPIAQALLQHANIPIAAPSANKFGHVSPTRPQHVWNDLLYENVWIIDPNRDNHQNYHDTTTIAEPNETTTPPSSITTTTTNDDDNNHNNHNTVEEETTNQKDPSFALASCCQVGVESTVAKVTYDKENSNDDHNDNMKNNNDTMDQTVVMGKVTILRQGAISAQQMEECLDAAGLLWKEDNPHNDHNNPEHGNNEKIMDENYHHDDDAMPPKPPNNNIPTTKTIQYYYRVETQTKRITPDHVANVAPGQSIRHYSPNIPSFMLSEKCIMETATNSNAFHTSATTTTSTPGNGIVVIDYGGKLHSWHKHVLAYRDLSPTANSTEAAQHVFETLRWAEQIPHGKFILFPNQLHVLQQGHELYNNNNNNNNKNDALLLAIQDRLTRAASGVTIDSLEELPS